MPDVTQQLAAYFDATVERVTAEDVLAGSAVHVQNGRSEPARVGRLRPAWVVAGGFVATMVVIGGVVGVALLFEGGAAEVGSGRAPVGDATDGLSGSWGLLIAVGLVLAAAIVGLVLRSRREIVKEQTMQTLERPEVEVSPPSQSPAVLIVLSALLAIAVATAGWLFVENRSLQSDLDDALSWPSVSELTAEEQRIYDVLGPEGSFVTAWRAGDVDAMLELNAANAEWWEGLYEEDARKVSMADGSLRSSLESWIGFGWHHDAELVSLTIIGRGAFAVIDSPTLGLWPNWITFDDEGLIESNNFG